MPSYVDVEKCDGCKGGEITACMYVCPNDLMVLDEEEMKAYNQEPSACWECYSCVKICPQGAISVRPYADFAPLGGTSIPLLSAEDIMWTVQFRDGSVKRFKFPNRTTPEGSIDPFKGHPAPDNIEDERQYTETELLVPEKTIRQLVEQEEMDHTYVWQNPNVQAG